jgi:hypothetical protein
LAIDSPEKKILVPHEVRRAISVTLYEHTLGIPETVSLSTRVSF